MTRVDLDASRRVLGVEDVDELRAQTFVAGAVVQTRVQQQSFVDVFMSDGIGDLIALLSITPTGSAPPDVTRAAQFIEVHGAIMSDELGDAFDVCFNWLRTYPRIHSLYVQVAALVDAHWAAIEEEAHRLMSDVRDEVTG